MKKIDRPASQRMATEAFQAEKAFEQRALVPLGVQYEFFGLADADFAKFKQTGVWPNFLERERPDWYVPAQRALYECMGCVGDYVRLRVTKPVSMAHWCAVLGAEGYYAIWNSQTQTGLTVPALKMAETINRGTGVTLEDRDNRLWRVPLALLTPNNL